MSTKTKYITIDELIDKFKEYNNNKEDIKLVRSAYEYAEKKHFGQKEYLEMIIYYIPLMLH